MIRREDGRVAFVLVGRRDGEQHSFTVWATAEEVARFEAAVARSPGLEGWVIEAGDWLQLDTGAAGSNIPTFAEVEASDPWKSLGIGQ